MEAALASGTDPAEVYVELFVPALRGIGDAWASGDIDVGVEHRASVIVMRMIGRLGPRFSRRGQTRGSVVIGAPPGDLHGLPTALLSDLVRGAGFAVSDLGADTPVDAFVRAARESDRLVAVAIGVTTKNNEASVRSLIEALHEDVPGVPVLTGGGALLGAEHAADLGADGWAPDGMGAIALLDTVAADVG